MTVTITGFGLAGASLALVLLDRGFCVQVVEDGRGGSSVVAAGLVNPLAGKNFEPGWRWGNFWPEAEAFYRRLEDGLFRPMPIERVMKSERDWRKFQEKRARLGDWLVVVTGDAVIYRGGGWLDTRRFLAAAKERFLERGGGWGARREDLGETEVEVDCRGAAGLRDGEAWPGPERCAKGEILTFRASGLEVGRILTGRGWVIPIGGGIFRAGATYDWDGLDLGPTEAGKKVVLGMIAEFGGREVEVLAHEVGVRPIVRRSQPFFWEKEPGRWVFNGLGSKGVVYAPRAARVFADFVETGEPLDEDLRWR